MGGACGVSRQFSYHKMRPSPFAGLTAFEGELPQVLYMSRGVGSWVSASASASDT